MKPTVCVDLDGVLAEYIEWKGIDHIGDPIKGARVFLASLRKFALVVIYTSRCNPEATDGVPINILAERISVWLYENNMPHDEIFAGLGKPLASAYVDDRAVVCIPQKYPSDYSHALNRCRDLCK